MLSTFLLLTIYIGCFLVHIVFVLLFLRFGLRWAKVPNVATRQVVFACVVWTFLEIAFAGVFLFAAPSTDPQSIALYLLQLTVSAIIPCAVIRWIFKTGIFRSFQAWLPTLLAVLPLLAILLLVVRPFLCEQFVIPTNAMAPTIAGTHWKGTCNECGQPNYQRVWYGKPRFAICEKFHVTRGPEIGTQVHRGDHIVALKLLTPRRWDLVVFRFPQKPSVRYVKRVVGFPGETILIKEGSVWVDGQELTPPDSIRGIQYTSQLPGWPDLWGSTRRPALLGDDEYFMLGDFSMMSKDSRLWERGAPGHNPFAVPESHIEGIVTHTYWPLSRLRIHR